MSKKVIIDIEAHALFGTLERGLKFWLNYYEAKERAFKAVRAGKPAKRKHLSKKGKTYYYYFQDNLSFYVICREKELEEYVKIVIKTVIIEIGRE